MHVCFVLFRFSVSLDDRIMAVRLPPFIDPGERIYVKAPLCTELQAAEINVDVATCALDAASSTMEGGSSEDGNACDNCTYVNPHLFPSCQMCGGTLLARRNPHTGAVRFLAYLFTSQQSKSLKSIITMYTNECN